MNVAIEITMSDCEKERGEGQPSDKMTDKFSTSGGRQIASIQGRDFEGKTGQGCQRVSIYRSSYESSPVAL